MTCHRDLANVIVVYLCRRKAKRDMNNEMNMQIESAVSQYFKLYDVFCHIADRQGSYLGRKGEGPTTDWYLSNHL